MSPPTRQSLASRTRGLLSMRCLIAISLFLAILLSLPLFLSLSGRRSRQRWRGRRSFIIEKSQLLPRTASAAVRHQKDRVCACLNRPGIFFLFFLFFWNRSATAVGISRFNRPFQYFSTSIFFLFLIFLGRLFTFSFTTLPSAADTHTTHNEWWSVCSLCCVLACYPLRRC